MKQRNLLFSAVTACIVICTFSCKDAVPQHTHLYTAFETCKDLHGETIPLDTSLFRYPFRVTVRDSFMLVMDMHNADDFYHIFSYPDGRHLVSFGRRGEGPEEVLLPQNIRFHSLDSIWTLDANKMEIVRWQYLPDQEAVQRVEHIRIGEEFVRVLDFIPTDSCILVPDYSGKSRYHRMDYTGNMISTHAQIPIANKENAVPALAQAWRSYMACDQPVEKLVTVTQLGEVVEIYDLVNDETVSVLIGPNQYPKYKVAEGFAIPDGIMGFLDVQVVGNTIYTVFDGRTFEERMELYASGQKPESGCRSIYVFDLAGSPLCRYSLDRAVSGIFVDEEKGEIVAVDVNSDDPIVRFAL